MIIKEVSSSLAHFFDNWFETRFANYLQYCYPCAHGKP